MSIRDILPALNYESQETTSVSQVLQTVTTTKENSIRNCYDGSIVEMISFELRENNVKWFMDNIQNFILETYQRGLVWNDLRKALLIDTIMIKGKIPGFLFQNKLTQNIFDYCYSILDGQQRLQALYEYKNNKFAWKCPVDRMDVYYNEVPAVNDATTTTTTTEKRIMTNSEMERLDNYKFEWTEFHHSCSKESMRLNFKRINQGKTFNKQDHIGIAEDTNFILHLVQGVFNVNTINEEYEGKSLYEIGFFKNFETEKYKNVNPTCDFWFMNESVKFTKAAERDLSNRKIIMHLMPFIIAGLNGEVIPYSCAQTSITKITDYLNEEYTDEHIIKVYKNLKHLTNIFKDVRLGTNKTKRSLRQYTKLPCMVMWYEQNYDKSNTNVNSVRKSPKLTTAPRLKWKNIIQYFEEHEDRVKEFERVIICGDTNRKREVSMIRTFCQRIVEKYPFKTFPDFYEQDMYYATRIQSRIRGILARRIINV